MPDAAYYRAWRLKNPEYMERERERSRSRSRTPEQRRAERERAKHKQQVKENIRESKRAYAARVYADKRADPEKVAKQREATLRWSRRRGNERQRMERAQERARKKLVIAEEIVARRISPDLRDMLMDPLYEDAVSVALIALIECNRYWSREKKYAVADEAVRDFIKGERKWRWYAQELPPEK